MITAKMKSGITFESGDIGTFLGLKEEFRLPLFPHEMDHLQFYQNGQKWLK